MNGTIPDDDVNIIFSKRKPNLHTVYACDAAYSEHRVALEDWNKQLDASERKLARKQASCSSSKSDLYQILGLFFVFQGVVVTAVAQANMLQCPNWYLPFFLSLLVSVAALGAAVQKLKEIMEFSEQHRLEKAVYSAIHKSLDDLKENGTEFDIAEGQPQLTGFYTATELKGQGSIAKFYSIISKFWSVWVFSYSGAVLLLLLLFSALTLFAVRQILCHPR